MTCPKCGGSAVFASRWQRRDGLLRPLFWTALRCHACGCRYLRLDRWGAAVTSAVLLASVAVIGIGGVVWKHPALPQAAVTASKKPTKEALDDALTRIGGMPPLGDIGTIPPLGREELEKPGAFAASGASPLRRPEDLEKSGTPSSE